MSHLHFKSRRRARTSARPQVEAMEARKLLSTIVVTGTGDTIANDGIVTLREAITAANTNAASGDAAAGDPGLDTIAFDIPGTGVKTITPASDLPTITEPIAIDGYTQHGSNPNTNPITTAVNAVPLIELSSAVGTGSTGLRITAGGSTVRGLVINGFQDGITLQTNGGDAIAGNFIGTDPTGTMARPLATFGFGISIVDSPNNTIGGPNPGDRNLLSGNVGPAIGNSRGDASGILIQGNFIGTDVTGSKALGNEDGILFVAGQSGSGITIGGTNPGARNLISGNTYSGIELGNYNGTVIQGNFIGTDITGTSGIGNNGSAAVDLRSGRGNTVGGTVAGARNVISANVGGIFLAVNDSIVQGNLIGTDVTGTRDLGNFTAGVVVNGTNNTVGGTVANAGNTIAFVTSSKIPNEPPIGVVNAPGNEILGNSIFGNLGPGIGFAGLSKPVLTGATGTSIAGTLNGPANTSFRLEFFATPDTGDFSNAQGKTFLGATDVITDTTGDSSFTFIRPTGIPAGQFLTATATGAAGSSAFSQAITIPTATGADLAVAVAGSPDTVAPGGTVTYTVTVTDGGPDDAQDVMLTAPVPAGTTFVSFSTAAGWTITAPAVGSSGGTITANTSALAATTSPVAFTFVVTLDGGAADGSTISDSASVASATTGDPNDANNSASTTTTVAATTPPPVTADLEVTQSASPATATVGRDDVTFTITVTNRGPASASNASLAETLPAGVTLVSATGGVTPSGGKLTFSLGDLADGSSLSFSVVVKPLSARTLTASATASATEADPSHGQQHGDGLLIRLGPDDHPDTDSHSDADPDRRHRRPAHPQSPTLRHPYDADHGSARVRRAARRRRRSERQELPDHRHRRREDRGPIGGLRRGGAHGHPTHGAADQHPPSLQAGDPRHRPRRPQRRRQPPDRRPAHRPAGQRLCDHVDLEESGPSGVVSLGDNLGDKGPLSRVSEPLG